MPDPNCPTHDELVAYVMGRLADEASHAIDSHVDTCPQCQAALETLHEADDSLVAELRLPVEQAGYVDEPQCRDALALAKAVASQAGAPATGATDQPTGDSTVLGEYQLLEKLGEGGMGAVYKARHTKLKRVVALKVMSKRRTPDDRALARFEREMEAVGQLDHPNIVRALDAREVDGMHFLVMELVKGMDLSELVARLGPLPIPDACELVRQAACGLQYAHEHGLIHRDIKPSNLMLTRKRGQEHFSSRAASSSSGEAQKNAPDPFFVEAVVKILDLGLALLHGPQSEAADELTGSGQMMGTLDYMAPEQGTDSHEVDVRADVYSLGATLYKLLSGHPPFFGPQYNTPVKKMMALATEPIPPIRDRRADVPDELAAILDRMLARDPADRYATPAEVAAALAPLTAGSDLPGLLARAEEQAGSRAEPEKLPAATDELASSALVRTDRSRPPASIAKPKPTRRRWKPLAVAVALLVVLIGGALAWQIIIRIRDREGRETVVEVPEGAEVRIEKDGHTIVRAPAADKSEQPEPGAPGKPKLTPIEIEPEAQQWEPGQPLSAMALVTQPASVPGVQSWTIETREHRGGINAVAHSPDGRLLATAGDDGTVRIRDASNGKVLRILIGHDDIVHSVAWSPDGRFVASASGDKTVGLWNATTGQQLRVLRGHEGPVRGVAWSPDGKYLLSGGGDKTLRIWEAESGKPSISFAMEATVTAVAWSPDGKHLASGGQDKCIYIREFGTRKLIQTLAHEDVITSVGFSPNVEVLVAAERSGAVRFWDLESGKRLHADADSRHTKGVGDDPAAYAVAFSPDGKWVASGGADKRIRVWEANSGYAVFDLKGPDDIVRAVSWSPDGKIIAAGSGPSAPSLRLWDIGTRAECQVIPGYPCDKATIGWVAWSPDGQKLAFNGGGGDWCAVFLLRQRTCRPELCGWRLHGERALWLPDGRFLIGLAESATLSMMDVESRKWVRAFENAPRWSTFDLSRDGTKLAVCHPRTNMARIIEVNSGEVLQTIEGHAKGVTHVALSPDGAKLATISSDGTGKAWDLASGQLLWEKTFEAGPHLVTSSPDGKLLAFADPWKETICDWSTGKSQKTLTYDAVGGEPSHAWSADGSTFASIQRNRLYLWDVETGRRLWSSDRCPLGLGRSMFGGRLSWSPDGRFLAISVGDHLLRIWEPRTNRLQLAAMILGERNATTGLAFTNDGAYQAWGDTEKAVVYVVRTDQGQETLPPEEFAEKYGWENDPGKVSMQ